MVDGNFVNSKPLGEPTLFLPPKSITNRKVNYFYHYKESWG